MVCLNTDLPHLRPRWLHKSHAFIIGIPYAYSGWSTWTSCSTACGVGSQTRYQTNCTGDCGPTCGTPVTQTQTCSVGVPFYLSSWGEWSNCSQYCGSGMQSRNQSCLGTCANSSASCSGGAVLYQTTSCTGGQYNCLNLYFSFNHRESIF